MKRIVLKGYYGFGNLGDDVVMLTCTRWLKNLFPKAQVLVATASKHGEYIIPFTQGMVEDIVPVSPEPEADLIVHGGGGTFYDFDIGNRSYHVLNRLIHLVGEEIFSEGLMTYRKLKGWPSNLDTRRIAVGVGLGTFTPSSRKYYHKIAELTSLEMILPRDPDSYKVLKQMRISGEIVQSSDLAFMSQYWLPPEVKPGTTFKRIGFVVKHWPCDTGYLAVLGKTARALKEQGYLVTIFLFEKNHDLPIIKEFGDFEVKVWCPWTGSLVNYLRLLASNSLLVTSRAHGAIIGAAFGIPSICIGIEPKLNQVANMFPRSAIFMNLALTFNGLYDSIISGLEVHADLVLNDFDENQTVLLNSLSKVEKYLQKY